MQDSEFQQRYAKLNPEQKQAVDTIDGPVLVIAGPGSGKTELLSLRVANILQKTDVLPSSILCLTFTETAATNMRKRLTHLIGQEAYRVAIHTFHSFGSEIISQNPEYFYNAATYTPADKLVQIQILEDIFTNLKHNNPLSSKHPEQGFTYLDESITAINDLKKAGVSAKEFRALLENDQQFTKAANAVITNAFAERISAKTLDRFNIALEELAQIPCPDSPLRNFKTVKETVIETLKEALAEDSTKPVTAWKAQFTKKDSQKNTVLKDHGKIEKLLALADIYQQYQDRLHQLGYFDFSDMVLDTVTAIENNPELQYNLQEQYQYILVDEFQDTNGVQSRLLDSLLDAEVNEGRPNILAVGDDDQSIFKFQGANIDNILSFHKKYRDPKIIVLDKNYRSTQEILNFVREIIIQGNERLENLLPDISKNLIASNPNLDQGHLIEKTFADFDQEMIWIAEESKKYREVAVIARKHNSLEQAAKIFEYYGIPVQYERKDNLLDQPHIQEIIQILTFVSDTTRDDLLPTILSYPFWNLSRLDIWQLSVKAHKSRKLWLEIMLENEKFKPIAEFFIHLEQEAKERTAEEIIDFITGAVPLKVKENNQATLFAESEQSFTSPYKNHYSKAQDYLAFIGSLDTFISAIRSHKGNQVLQIPEVLEFVNLLQKHNIKLSHSTTVNKEKQPVTLLTAHKAKGLEFETVFVINCQESQWVSRGKSSKLAFTSNLPLSADKDTVDDKLRLFYVALTRAKSNLYLTHHLQAQSGKDEVKLRFLSANTNEPEKVLTPEELLQARVEILRHQPAQEDEQELLKQQLVDYKLSVTHLNKFLNLVYAGPQSFLEENILRFPQKMSPDAAYGSAVHDALNQIHSELKRSKTLPALNFLLEAFQRALTRQRLNKKDFQQLLERGKDNLAIYYKERIHQLTPYDLTEFDFKQQGVVLGTAHLTGKIDRLAFDQEEIIVYDYKTGKPLRAWDQGYEGDLIKSWQNKNQLIFYKILVENSRNYKGKYQVHHGSLEFIEPGSDPVYNLPLEIDPHDHEQLVKLTQIIYTKIINLDFPDTSTYEKSIHGIMDFTLDLLEGNI